MKQAQIRNFAIIAHIDHGKSTLADQIMALTKTVSERERSDQMLDDMEVEQEHGVTVKARTVRNFYQAQDGQEYEYNLIDTPGHVDFNYEVAKSLAATEGALLLVDATQGIQAQTIANYRIAKKNNLALIPVINKADIASADVVRTQQQLLELDKSFTSAQTLLISAKTGQGVPELLEAIRTRIPAPSGNSSAPLKALVFDSIYDAYQGVIINVRLVDGQLTATSDLQLMQADLSFRPKGIGVLTPNMQAQKDLQAGEVGYIVTGIKDPKKIRVGDTITTKMTPTKEALPGYEPAKQLVFAGIYPKNNDFPALKQALNKLSLNDTSFSFVEERSEALGQGFRCGFLGTFHLEIIRERLKDEYGIDVLTTAPNVTYFVYLKNGQTMKINNPAQYPAFGLIDHVTEPFIKAEIMTPNDTLNAILKLVEQHKGTLLDLDNDEAQILVTVKMPLSEVAYHFFSELKSVSHGYATLNTEFLDYEDADLVKIEVDINYAPVDSLSFVVHRGDAPQMAQKLVKELKYTVPRRLYPTPVQAIVEGKAIARVDVPPLRKNAAVDGKQRSVSKKAALLRRQSLNKRRAAQGEVKLPQEVFNVILEL
ncbi:translation elongation factor 4 [Lactobacillus sp. ESL0679]|uniref:translation elongation factor 4 n=1 Tax=Lactobacillus sp. ESL0679 TaxID=2983209 RepID=UPI0023F78816|nr:translation elongation factor 4 [Lactobacillus sp. ESL0679]MDF7682217.1 translation elongation factor 4 [Lactobacillus sp. ESL0679]